ncbi:hypothetical protein J1N35_045049 [Gossypium stocksii]|uniref:DUF4283 domain-containing protein n=1 Tax=Gossypium stocksii TaxID=47602 RepID=A0A9D3UAP0_9ROSI|nr:hypothetical protein J1N35_045049 [Gossypium stocksii]
MDVENGYFLAKFKNTNDYERVLCQGPWVVFGQKARKMGRVERKDVGEAATRSERKSRFQVLENLDDEELE